MKTILKNWLSAIHLKWFFIGFLSYSLVVAGISQLLITPQIKRYESAKNQMESLENTLVNLVKLNVDKSLENVNRDIQQLTELKDTFHTRTGSDTTLRMIIPIIDRYCRSVNLTVKKLEPLNKVTFLPPDHQYSYVSAELTGKYEHFIQLLERLEQNPDWILLDNFHMRMNEDNRSKNRSPSDILMTLIFAVIQPMRVV